MRREEAMRILSWRVGPLATNCYAVLCEESREALIIDPGLSAGEERQIIDNVIHRGFKVKFILNTHGHADHISGNGILKRLTDAWILIHEEDAFMLTDPHENLSFMLGLTITSPKADRLLRDEDSISLGELEFKVIHTPGHTRGSISLFSMEEKIVFTGDTLFAGSIGRTDLPGSSFRDMMDSLRRLMELPDETIVYPGHGDVTSIGWERRSNPYIS